MLLKWKLEFHEMFMMTHEDLFQNKVRLLHKSEIFFDGFESKLVSYKEMFAAQPQAVVIQWQNARSPIEKSRVRTPASA